MAAMSAATSLLAQPLPEGAAVREAVIHPVEGGAPAEPPIAGLERAAGRAPLRRPEKRSSIRQRGTQARYRRDGDHNTRRFGDGLSIGSSRLCRSPDYEPDCEVSYIDSLDHGFSSSDKENARPGRKRHLDDALFEFFRKEAIKSLKNNFSNFCCHSDLSAQNKRIKGHVIGRDDFTCYSIKYYWDFLNSLSNCRKEVIRNFGFGCLLFFEKSEIPSAFVRWLASCLDPISSQIIVDDCKFIPISKEFVHHVIGLPNSGSVPIPDSAGGAKFIMSMFGLRELPHITFFWQQVEI